MGSRAQQDQNDNGDCDDKAPHDMDTQGPLCCAGADYDDGCQGELEGPWQGEGRSVDGGEACWLLKQKQKFERKGMK